MPYRPTSGSSRLASLAAHPLDVRFLIKMILLFAIYIIVALFLIGGSIFLRGMVRKVLLSLTIMFVTLPLCFIVFIGVFKSEIQQGKFLSGLGPLLILFAPPQDLWIPLDSHNLDPSKSEYNFKFKHKYIGNHVVELSFMKLKSMEEANSNFEVTYTVSNNSGILFTLASKKGWPYWGMNESGLTFISYNVPKTLPVKENLSATITIKGDIKAFIDKYGVTKVSIKKGSDE